MWLDLGRGLSGAWRGPPPGCCPHTDAGAVDGALDLAGAGRGEPWGRPGHSGRCGGGVRGVSPTLQCPGSECVFGLRVFFIHLSVQLIFLGSSGVPNTVLGVGSGHENVTHVHGPGDQGSNSQEERNQGRDGPNAPQTHPPAAQRGDKLPPADWCCCPSEAGRVCLEVRGTVSQAGCRNGNACDSVSGAGNVAKVTWVRGGAGPLAPRQVL